MPFRILPSTYIDDANFTLDEAKKKILINNYQINSLDAFGLQDYSAGICASALIINFLTSTQKMSLKHLKNIRTYTTNQYLEMDYSTRGNLELTSALERGEKGKGLYYLSWITVPLLWAKGLLKTGWSSL